jgi:predicted ArsR family transcriptional regulator
MTSSPNPMTADTTARRTLETVARRGPMTVRQLVQALGITTTAVRAQVNRLHADGWLVRTRRPGKTGRPADVFALSEKADRLFAGQMDELAGILIDEVLTRENPARRREILTRVGQRIKRSTQEQVGTGTAARRLHRLAQHLRAQGDLVQASESGKGLRLTLHRCPFGPLAHGHEEVCAMERQTFSELVGTGARLEKRLSAGHACCEFTFSPARADSTAPQP